MPTLKDLQAQLADIEKKYKAQDARIAEIKSRISRLRLTERDSDGNLNPSYNTFTNKINEANDEKDSLMKEKQKIRTKIDRGEYDQPSSGDPQNVNGGRKRKTRKHKKQSKKSRKHRK
jgi:hypothetical protein